MRCVAPMMASRPFDRSFRTLAESYRRISPGENPEKSRHPTICPQKNPDNENPDTLLIRERTKIQTPCLLKRKSRHPAYLSDSADLEHGSQYVRGIPDGRLICWTWNFQFTTRRGVPQPRMRRRIVIFGSRAQSGGAMTRRVGQEGLNSEPVRISGKQSHNSICHGTSGDQLRRRAS